MLSAVLLCGCESKKPIFPLIDPPLVWPSPPEAPRIHHVGALVSDQDLKPPKSFFKSIDQLIFGKKAARSMLSPYALCTDDNDRLFVADSNAQLVHVFNLDTRKYEQWRPPPEADLILNQPVGIAFDSIGKRLLVADSVTGAIVAFNSAGAFLGELASGELSRPCGLVVDAPRKRIFVADAGTHQLIALNLDGTLLARIGSRGTELGQFNYPTNIALDASGRIYVSDSLNHRVQVFDSEFTPLHQIGRQGDMPGYFSQPKGIAIDSENHVYVVDSHFESVQIFDAQGQLLLTFGEEGNGPGQFWLPAGIYIDAANRIWIADSYNRRVQVFDYRPQETQ